MSETVAPKKKGLSLGALKGKVEVVKQGELRVGPAPITSLKKPEEVDAEERAQDAVKPSRPLQPGSRLIFGSKPASGLKQAPKPVVVTERKVVPKPVELPKASLPPPKATLPPPPPPPPAKPAKKVTIVSTPQVKIVSAYKPRSILKKLKVEFDGYVEDAAVESYEDIPFDDMKGDADESGRYFFIYRDDVDEDFTKFNEEFTAIEFTKEGVYMDESDLDVLAKDKAKLFSMLNDLEIKTQAQAKDDEEDEEEEDEEEEEEIPVTNYEKLQESELGETADAILYLEGKIPGESLKDKLESHYTIEKPESGYIPPNRRSFSGFIYDLYRTNFELPAFTPDDDACLKAQQSDRSEMYKYQQFVKEYMSWQTPYRGILVYHGLGSGKTCTSIAAAEALFATADKKIIVMTPFSLRQNFIGEITTCGFRHFRLKNHWTEYKFSENPIARIFARSVMQIPSQYLERVDSVWIPDFEKEPNYSTLSPEKQNKIRDQITNTLVYDPNPKKGLHGRIWFVNYNGISAKELLKIACQRPDAFDNAVIIVDEIHNLIRYMQGTIEPYIVELTKKGTKRKIDFEPITWKRWEPKLCPADWSKFEANKVLQKKNYKRGYLFYRLFLQAQNSKIIGLSGTPMINFPEEMAILANILHGYLQIVEGNIAKTDVRQQGSDAKDAAIIKSVEEILTENPYIDFMDVKKLERTIQFRATFLPEGIRKVKGQVGVERIPPEENAVSFPERLASLQSALDAKTITVIPASKDSKLKVVSQPLLPPVGSDFRNTFVKDDLVSLQNDIVLLKRLSGLISYYKGSREDLMPKVTKDETLFIPMSAFQKTQYSKVRLDEITIEEQKEKKKKEGGEGEVAGRLAALYSEVYEIKNSTQSSNYRMASRQACNFAFPAEVNRPRPRSKEDKDAEIGEDVEDIRDQEAAEGEDLGSTKKQEEKLEEEVQEEEEDLEDAVENEGNQDEFVPLNADAFNEEAALDEAVERGLDGDDALAYVDEKRREFEGSKAEKEAVFDEDAALDEAVEKGLDGDEAISYMEAKRAEFEAGKQKKKGKTALTMEEKKCRVVKFPGETYPDRIKRAKDCLSTVAVKRLKLGPGGLADTSPKFQKIIENISAARGPSLVYSQFLQMEGIGIFTLALEANGYEPIEINFRWETKQAFFSPQTKETLKKGPSPNPSEGIKQLRYIKFTGGEEDLVRRYALLLFNGRFSELPKEMSSYLAANGWTGNTMGDLCRVFCITSAGAEGISLKSVRAVHIMEPYWNDVRTNQVKGRAIRICSHADLAPSERTVDVFTYVSVFSPASQISRVEPEKIAEKIAQRDSLTAEEAKALGLNVPKGAGQYTITSDERLFIVAERKKRVIDNLQKVMKVGSIDCKLNKTENKEKCVTFLPGKVGDFLYDPDLETDIKQTALTTTRKPAEEKPAEVPKTVAAAKAVTVAKETVKAPQPAKEFFEGSLGGVSYFFEPIKKGDAIEKYILYKSTDTSLTKAIGEIQAKPSKKNPGTFVPNPSTLTMY